MISWHDKIKLLILIEEIDKKKTCKMNDSTVKISFSILLNSDGRITVSDWMSLYLWNNLTRLNSMTNRPIFYHVYFPTLYDRLL